uniref:Acetyltransferase GNAT domain protein n=1 Tax=Marseillevirus LCMAC103 TaxID=2506604 RepID=A0A481YW18_9VIRU|nr:MAG: acetyltransferase GNAT domain protein [Marseillevirus LCMAC103]
MSHTLSNFVIHPEYQRQGIGTRLMRRVYDDLQFYLGVARVEWLVETGTYDFYLRATKNMGAKFVEFCPNMVEVQDCDCWQCRPNDGEFGLDQYHSHGFGGCAGCSHLAVLVKLEPTQ